MMAVSASMCVICWFCAQTTNKHIENGRWCGLSCSYLPTYVPWIILIKCVRTHSYSIAIAQILRKAFTYITFWFATTLSLSFSLSAFFFNRNGKKLPRKIQRPLYLKLIRWFWFVCAIHCLFLTYYSVCTFLKLWYLFLLFHAHMHKTRTENSLKLKIWWTTFQISNETCIQNHF